MGMTLFRENLSAKRGEKVESLYKKNQLSQRGEGVAQSEKKSTKSVG